MVRIPIDHDRVADFCRCHHIRKLSFLELALRDDFAPDSEADVLVEFEPGKTPGLAFFGLDAELSEILGRKVDLNTAGFLGRRYRDEVIRTAEAVYDAA